MIKDGGETGIKQVYRFDNQGPNRSYIKLGTLPTVSVTGLSTSKVMFTVKGGINFGGTNESVYEVAASTRGSIQVTSTLVRGNRELKFGYVSTSSNVEIWIAYDGSYRGVTEVEVSASINFTLAMTETTTKPSGFVEGSYRILASTEDNVASATKLQTTRTLWGQPFNGTTNVDGTINISGTSSSYNQGIRIHTFTNSALSSIWFRATNTDGYQAGMWGISVDDNGMRFRGNTSKTATSDPIDYMNILHGGNVGIGTVSPSSKLTVNGVGNDKSPVQLVNASRNGTWVYTASFLAPNLTSNNNNAIFIGKAHSTCNAFGLTHMHIGDGSVNNYAALEVLGVGNV